MAREEKALAAKPEIQGDPQGLHGKRLEPTCILFSDLHTHTCTMAHKCQQIINK